MTNSILVLDLETTGLHGIADGDKIVEVSIASVDFTKQTVRPIFTSPVHYDDLTEKERTSFIFREGYMEPNDVYDAPFDEEKVAAIVANILEGEYVTTFNTEFDLDKFLMPWMDQVIPDINVMFFRAPCIMRAADQVAEIPRRMHDDMRCWPSLQASYRTLCASDYDDQLFPHHAQDDCLMAGRVLLELADRYLYDPDREDEYGEVI